MNRGKANVVLEKELGERIRSMEAQLTTLFESDLIGIIRASLTGDILNANDAFLRIIGYTREELLSGRVRLADITPEELRARDRQALEELLTTGTHRPFEKEYIRKDGTRIPIIVGATMERGSKDFCIAFILDITQQKATEERLRGSEEHFSTLADSIPQLAWMADHEGYIFWYNRRWYDYTGTTLEDMQGWGWQNVHDPKEVNRVTERFKQSIATGEPWEDTFPLRSRDGEYRWFLSRALPIRDAEGRVVRWFGTNTDVEEQRRTEQELAHLIRERELMLEEVSTPIIPLWRDVLALPLVGSLDVERMMRATQAALDEVARTNARLCIIDITGARIVDAQAVANLSNLVAALKLVGADAVVAGVTAQAARTLVQLGLDLNQMRTHRTLAEALAMFIKSHDSKYQGTGNTRNAVSKNFR